MRQKRFISPSAETASCLYHCVSRVVDREFKLGRKEKEVFVKMMREYEDFCGVQVLAYCVMSNHFHLLVEVPPKVKDSAVMMTDEAFLLKIKKLYSRAYYLDVRQLLGRLRESDSDKAAEDFKAKYTRRMHDLSFFMKGLKQRFTQWFNGHHGRRGTLWEGRFKSVLVESGYAARVMAEKPEDYKWCSYGEAVRSKNNRKAHAGLCRVLQKNKASQQQRNDTEVRLADWHGGVAEMYRMMLFSDGKDALG